MLDRGLAMKHQNSVVVVGLLSNKTGLERLKLSVGKITTIQSRPALALAKVTHCSFTASVFG